MNADLLAYLSSRYGAHRSKTVLASLLLVLLLALIPALSDVVLDTALVPAALADGPQSSGGG